MIRRRRRVLPATLVALVLLAAMVLVVVSCVQLIVGQVPVLPLDALAATGSGVAWNAPGVFAAAGVLVVLGVILCACAWLPGTPTVLPLDGRGGGMSAGVTRASLSRDLDAAAEGVDGIAQATSTLSPTRARITVRTGLTETGDLAEQVRTVVGDRLTAVALARPPRITINVEKARST